MSKLEQIEGFLRDQPNDAFLLFARAKELENLEKWEDALAQYEELKSLHTDYTGLYYHLGKLYERAGLQPKALEIYAEGIQIAKEQADHHSASELQSAKLNLELEIEE